MERLVGGIRIENSNLTSLSFFKNPSGGFVVYCKTYGIYLRKNPYLVDVDFLKNVEMNTEYSLEGCDFEVENNKMLNVEELCSSEGDEEDITKVMDVRLLFGSLIIENTQLKSLEYLSGLKYIVKLDENSPLIQIVSNPKLKKMTLLSLEHAIARENRSVILQDNFKSNNSKKCNILDKWSMFKEQLDLDYMGSDCGELSWTWGLNN
ncbi:unnamed protein product [Caenorhabditis nigoni]